MTSAKDILYGWAPGARPFAESVRCLPDITDVEVGPIVAGDCGSCTTAVCIPSRRGLQVTIRYLADGADQIIFARRRITADPVALTSAVTRLWRSYRSTSRRDTVVPNPRKEAAMPLITREDVHPDTVATAKTLERLSSVRSVSVGARKRRHGKDRVTEPLPIEPGLEAKKVLVISPAGDGFYDEIFLFPRNAGTADVVYHDAVALLDGRTDSLRDGPMPAEHERPPRREPAAPSEAETLRARIDQLRCVERASLEPPQPRDRPGPAHQPSVKAWYPGDDHITVIIHTETHFQKIHVRPLIDGELEDVHEQVRILVSRIEGAAPQPKPDHNGTPATPEPSAPERMDPMPRGRMKSVELTPKEAEVHEHLLRIAGKSPDPDMPKKAEKKFGESVVNQWYALRKKGLIEKTADGYLVRRAKINVKQRGDAIAKKPGTKKTARKEASTPTAQPKSKDPLHAAVAFFTKHPELLERELFEEAVRHLAYLDKHNWKLVLKGGEVSLAPASKE